MPPLPALMMETPLTLPMVLRRAKRLGAEKEIVSRRADGTLHRTTHGEFYRRVIRLMNALRDAGIRPGDRVASFGWNHYRHLELYFAVPCMGAVLHTMNVRLPAEHLRSMIGHAGDRWIFFDRCLSSALGSILPELPEVESIVPMDDGSADPLPDHPRRIDYEAFVASGEERDEFPELDENAAAGLCYTSGTTDRPKGVLFSHRSYVLHAMSICTVDSLGIGERETVMPVVPMFHANAWGLPHAAIMTGAKIVLPGPNLSGRVLADLIEGERVTLTAGVPTIMTLLYHHLRKAPADVSSLRWIIIGGAAPSRSLMQAFEAEFGVPVLHAWGMTETTPVGLVCRLKKRMEEWPEEERIRIRGKQGRPPFGIETRVTGPEGEAIPDDGAEMGELEVRGPWVARSYFGNEAPEGAFTTDGWFRTGDVVTHDADGYVEIVDRSKDVIKSRGEWISSIEMENAAAAHPGVGKAAVVGRPDPLRDEAPVLFVVPREGGDETIDRSDLRRILAGRFARWQLPKITDIHVVDAIPETGVGKIDKKLLRAMLADGEFDRAREEKTGAEMEE